MPIPVTFTVNEPTTGSTAIPVNCCEPPCADCAFSASSTAMRRASAARTPAFDTQARRTDQLSSCQQRCPAGCAGRRRIDHHSGRVGRKRRRRPESSGLHAAAAVYRMRRNPVRLLYAGADTGCPAPVGHGHAAQRSDGADGNRGCPVPLYRIHETGAGDPAGGGTTAGRGPSASGNRPGATRPPPVNGRRRMIGPVVIGGMTGRRQERRPTALR